MPFAFHCIGLMGKQHHDTIGKTLQELFTILQRHKLEVLIHEDLAEYFPGQAQYLNDEKTLNKACDLMIVVGGDGSLLRAVRAIAGNNVPLLGINRGTLGFLADIHPDELDSTLYDVLQGNFKTEQRHLLDADIQLAGKPLAQCTALNDIVLLPGIIAHMARFDIHVDDQFLCHQRADGLIVATPTGSTAYALSAGGPILHPSLDATVLVPMFPHTLSSRPIVVNGSSNIRLDIAEQNSADLTLSADGSSRIPIPPGARITVQKSKKHIILLHPKQHDYYQVLRNKLHWEKK